MANLALDHMTDRLWINRTSNRLLQISLGTMWRGGSPHFQTPKRPNRKTKKGQLSQTIENIKGGGGPQSLSPSSTFISFHFLVLNSSPKTPWRKKVVIQKNVNQNVEWYSCHEIGARSAASAAVGGWDSQRSAPSSCCCLLLLLQQRHAALSQKTHFNNNLYFISELHSNLPPEPPDGYGISLSLILLRSEPTLEIMER